MDILTPEIGKRIVSHLKRGTTPLDCVHLLNVGNERWYEAATEFFSDIEADHDAMVRLINGYYGEGPGRIVARASLGGEFPIFTLSVVQRDPSSSIDHVSTKPPSHPGQSAFPSPVVDHSFPLMPFPTTGET